MAILLVRYGICLVKYLDIPNIYTVSNSYKQPYIDPDPIYCIFPELSNPDDAVHFDKANFAATRVPSLTS